MHASACSTATAPLVALALLGCTDLDRFTTGPNEAYCGAITLSSTFRTGFSQSVQMRLTLDAGLLDSATHSPGTLSTYDAPSGSQPEQRLLNDAPLRAITPLPHDALSHLEFGEGRERNAIFGVSTNDRAGDSLLAVL